VFLQVLCGIGAAQTSKLVQKSFILEKNWQRNDWQGNEKKTWARLFPCHLRLSPQNRAKAKKRGQKDFLFLYFCPHLFAVAFSALVRVYLSQLRPAAKTKITPLHF
jgi:hypothetical protein